MNDRLSRRRFARYPGRMRSVLLSLVGLSLLAATAAEARKPEDVFAGKVILSDKPFPMEARSADAYVSAVKKQGRDRFTEDKENKQWRIFYAAFFKAPVNDLDVSLKMYDITGGGERLVEAYEQNLADRGLRVLVGKVMLKRGDGTGGYDPNTKIKMVMQSRGKVIATAVFNIIGEGRKYSGKVEFTEEEAQKGVKEEPAPKK
jgi:hypothetical protein